MGKVNKKSVADNTSFKRDSSLSTSFGSPKRWALWTERTTSIKGDVEGMDALRTHLSEIVCEVENDKTNKMPPKSLLFPTLAQVFSMGYKKRRPFRLSLACHKS